MEKNVSVIIPSYNRAHILHETIPTYVQDITLEVIVVDDGSDDDTREKIRELHEHFQEIKYIHLKKHKGLPTAKNVGVNKARGKYIFFGDDDAVLYSGTLHRLRDAVENFPADIAGANGSYAGSLQEIENLERYIERNFKKIFDVNTIVDFNTGIFDYRYKIDRCTEGLYAMSSFLIKAELAKRTKFDEGYIVNGAREDMDYLARLAKQGRKMVYVPDAYEIDLPAAYVKGGGCHELKLWKRCVFIIYNNIRFINRNYKFLKEQGYMTDGKMKVQWNYNSIVLKSLLYAALKRISEHVRG